MAISANTLFHFTKKERLKKILKNGFLPNYTAEDLSNITTDESFFKVAHTPMVCFCDLVFSQIKEHIEFYGEYGIGLRKDSWAKVKGISPIVYVPENSISASLIQLMATEIGNKLKDDKNKDAVLKQLHNFYTYVKPYNGFVFNKKSKTLEDKIFYNEREWRFVPKEFPVLGGVQAKKDEIKKANLEMQGKSKLNFVAKDIKYIIVKTEKEIPAFVEFIEKDLKDRFPNEKERKILVSKLISVDQIGDDM
jgi:hypothetical protein